MEVLVGTTFGIDTVNDRSRVTEALPAGLLLKKGSNGGGIRIGLRRCVRSQAEELSESSSSLGESSENEQEEEDDADSSQGRWFDSFSSSLEDSLPIKRGLSKHYIGKSESFGNLMEARNVKNLEKMESPLNKRRRLLIANKLRRKISSFYSKINPNSMPLLALQEYDQEDHKYNDDDQTSEKRMKMTNTRDSMAQSQSCLCLSSFQDRDP